MLVVLLDPPLFIQIKCLYDGVNIVLGAPFKRILKHHLYIFNFELSCPAEPQVVIVCELIDLWARDRISLHPVLDLIETLLLGWREIANITTALGLFVLLLEYFHFSSSSL